MDKKALIKALRDTVQSASNTVASGVSAPVDLIAAGLRKVGLPIPQAPIGGSQWMENMGLTVPVEDGIPKLAGETLGMIVPMAATAKAPQIAAAANKGLENLAAPRTLNTPGYGGQRGAIVWHGSPHKFDKFDASKIGTGEGAQAYGHGLYFAEDKDIAKYYQKKLSEDLPDIVKLDEHEIMGKRVWATNVINKKGKAYSAGYLNEEELSNLIGAGNAKNIIDRSNKGIYADNLRLKINDNQNLYKVDLPDEAIARMLDWDKTIGEQGLSKFIFDNKLQHGLSRIHGFKNVQDFNVSDLVNSLGGGDFASKKLQKLGIPGIRYLDASSRATGGTSNFVVFPGEERLLKILERNNQPMGLMGVK